MTEPMYRIAILQLAKKILNIVLAATIMSCGILATSVIVFFNPYLSNDKYRRNPSENIMNLLLTTIPVCLFLFRLFGLFCAAALFEGKLNIQGVAITTKQALVIAFTDNNRHFNSIVTAVAYPITLKLATYVMTWKLLAFYNLHVAMVSMIFFVSEVFSYHHTIVVLATQTIRDKSKALASSMIQFKKFGIMKKVASKAKRYRHLKLSLKLSIPWLVIGVFTFFYTGATRYFLQQRKLIIKIYCLVSLLLKVCMQSFVRKYVSKTEATSSSPYLFLIIFGCTILLDCPIRLMLSQIDSQANFILFTGTVAVAEVSIRCASIYRVMKSNANATCTCKQHMIECKNRRCLAERRKRRNFIYLFMLEVEADMCSEYVAINSIFILNCFFGHYEGFLVGKTANPDVYKQLRYFFVQYSMEMLVDFVSYAIESSHPLIREIMAKEVSIFCAASTLIVVGVYSMIVLILLMVQ